MPRIFLSLAVIAISLVAVALIYGLVGGDYNALSQELRTADDAARDGVLTRLEPVQRHVRVHMLIGILATLVAVLVQSIGITYFIGTGRWCKEVVTTYGLSDELTQRSTQLKREAFPFAMLGIATTLVIAAFGAAADPGTLRATTAKWVAPHYWASIVGIIVLAAALWRQTSALVKNQQLIDAVLEEVGQVRKARGLDG